jgi:hypothetical protein
VRKGGSSGDVRRYATRGRKSDGLGELWRSVDYRFFGEIQAVGSDRFPVMGRYGLAVEPPVGKMMELRLLPTVFAEVWLG